MPGRNLLFALLSTQCPTGWSLRRIVSSTDAGAHRIVPMLEDLRMLGLLDVDFTSEPVRYRTTARARALGDEIQDILAGASPGHWGTADRRALRNATRLVMLQEPGRILVYANDGTRRGDLDFKGQGDPYGRAGWIEAAPLDLYVPEVGEIAAIKTVLQEVASLRGLRGPREGYRSERKNREIRVFEHREGGHLRFRPVDGATGEPLRDPRADPEGWAPATRRQDLRRELQALADEITGGTWTVRATPGLTTIDLFPKAHTKALARDHLLAGAEIGERRQLVVFADRWDGNDGPLLTTPLPQPDDRFLVLSVATDEAPLLARARQGLVAPGVGLGHIGDGASRTEAFLRRLLVLHRKGRPPTAALARTLSESLRSDASGLNAGTADAIATGWDLAAPITLAFDIDGTLNRRDGGALHGDIPSLLWELDSRGFQLALITGKDLDRIQKDELLAFPEGTSSFEGGAL